MHTPFFQRVLGPIMNLISGTHHSCAMREYAFIFTLGIVILN